MQVGDGAERLILDGTKIQWHLDRVAAWERGERIAPITIDMALTRGCNYACEFCYAMVQENARKPITREVIFDFLEDCAEIGVKAISFVSDGESSISPVFVDAIEKGHALGLSMAVATNALVLTEEKLERILPCLTYLRVNISGGEPARYAEIMGTKEQNFFQVCKNIEAMMRLKKERNLGVTIGMQMVLLPHYADQIIPLAALGKRLRPDYLVIKHCTDSEDGALGVDYKGYAALHDLLREAEAMSDAEYTVRAKWSKILSGKSRSYQRCYGTPFMLQMSGSGLVAPCGSLFNERYKKFHMGNITETRFRDIFHSDRYWNVVNYLASPQWNAQTMCASLCLQHKVNEALDAHVKGELTLTRPTGPEPMHLNYI